METKYSKVQISNAITHWKKVLESMESNPPEDLDEARTGNVKDAVKSVVGGAAKAVKDAATATAKVVGKSVRNVFWTNKGVQQLVDIIKHEKLIAADGGRRAGEVKLGIRIDQKFYKITGFETPESLKGGNPLLFLVDPKDNSSRDNPTLKDLLDFIKPILKGKKIQLMFDGIAIGVGKGVDGGDLLPPDATPVDEAEGEPPAPTTENDTKVVDNNEFDKFYFRNDWLVAQFKMTKEVAAKKKEQEDPYSGMI